MLFPDLGNALIPHRGHPGQRGRMACQPCPRQLTLLQRASRQLQGQGGREKEKTLRSLLSLRVAYGCAMKCGGGPTQPTYHHLPITAQHQCTQVRDHLICFAQGNFVTLGVRSLLTASALGDRSLMWAYHITGTPGCSTPKADKKHSLG